MHEPLLKNKVVFTQAVQLVDLLKQDKQDLSH